MEYRSNAKLKIAICPARINDLSTCQTLAHLSLLKFQLQHLSREQIDASYELAGVEKTLIEDGTYFLAYTVHGLVGCGGWSRRATLFGKGIDGGKEARLLDPKTEAARLRAIHTDFTHGRKGVGTLMLAHCEAEVMKAGFQDVDALATCTGELLLSKAGYRVLDRQFISTSSGAKIPFARMTKHLEPPTT